MPNTAFTNLNSHNRFSGQWGSSLVGYDTKPYGTLASGTAGKFGIIYRKVKNSNKS